MYRNWLIILVVAVFIFVSFFLGKMLTTEPSLPLALAVGALVAIITFQRPENGLVIIVFSMMLSPEIIVAQLPKRAVTIRVDDILIIVVFLAWLAHTAVNKDWKGFVKTPLDTPLLILFFLYVFSTIIGIMTGNMNPVKGFFYAMKYIEYFILYWMVVNIASYDKDIPLYLISGLVTCIIVTLFAYSLMGSAFRVYAPFDAEGGEPASLGGYYLVIYAIAFSFFLHTASRVHQLLYLGLILFLLPPFVKTLSRASYLAFGPMLVTMLLLAKKRRMTLGLMMLVGLTAFPILFNDLYQQMATRVNATFTTDAHVQRDANYDMGGKKITDQSAIDRLVSWKRVLSEDLPKNGFTLLFGNGIAGIRFTEGQFFLMLAELGVVGTIVFYWLMVKIVRHSYRVYKSTSQPLHQSLCLALISCMVALHIQSFTTNTFIIVRVMEPFWFLTGLVMNLPLEEKEATASQLQPAAV